MALAVLDDSVDALLPWVDPAFLGLFGLAQPLVYFSKCPSFDARSNTAECLNQGLAPSAMAAQLPKMVGVQYEVLEGQSAPQLAAIGMFWRAGPHDKELLKVYYILDGTVFRAPSLGEVFMQRIGACARELGDAMTELVDAAVVLPGGHPTFGFSSTLPDAEVSAEEAEKRRKDQAAAALAGAELDHIILHLYGAGEER